MDKVLCSGDLAMIVLLKKKSTNSVGDAASVQHFVAGEMPPT